jgi:hypothetical protein
MQFPIVAPFARKSDNVKISGEIWKADPASTLEDAPWQEWIYPSDAEEANWDWDKTIQECLEKPVRYELYSAWISKKVHGLLVIDKTGQQIKGEKALVIDYLAVNPANRSEQTGLKYIGTALVAVAVCRSVEIGMKGQIFLDSLRQSERFYNRIGMTVLDTLSSEGYKQYHLDVQSAHELLKQQRELGMRI